MEQDRGHRRLVAVVFTDIVQFTALAQRDEEAALELVRRQAEVIAPVAIEHHGRVVKQLGDGCLLEFGSALDAVRFAQEVQSHLAGGPDRPALPTIRIGIHVGDVEVIEGDILGDAVNVASRVIRFAPPGGISLTDDAYRQLASHPEFVFTPLGCPPLKHVNRQIEIFRLETTHNARSKSIRKERETTGIAVLPFANLSSEIENQHFCDGLADELIHALTRLRGLRVVSRSSSFAFKGLDRPIQDIGGILGVSAVVEGSVRKMGNRIRVTAQLVDVDSDTHLWAGTYDRDLEDIFAIQNEVADAIVGALKIAVTPEEREGMVRSGTQNVNAYELYLQGVQQYWRFSITGLRAARSLFREAIAIDPSFVQAHFFLAQAAAYHFFFWGDQAMFEDARKSADRLMELAPDSAEAAIADGLALHLSEQFDRAGDRFVLATERNPQSYDAWYALARCRFEQGRNEESIEAYLKAADIRIDDYQSLGLAQVSCRAMGDEVRRKEIAERALPILQRSRRLHPDDPRAAYFEASAHTVLGDPSEASRCLEHAISLGPHDPSILYNAACVYSLLGKCEESISCLEKVAKLGFSDVDWLERDLDLSLVRPDPRFKLVLSAVSENRRRALVF